MNLEEVIAIVEEEISDDPKFAFFCRVDADEIEALRLLVAAAKTLDEAAELLKELEWIEEHDEESFCPVCMLRVSDGHNENCRLAVFLARWGK